MVGLGTIPAGLQLIFLFFLPESRKSQYYCNSSQNRISPSHTARILLKRGQVEQARVVLSKIYAYASPNHLDSKVCFLGNLAINVADGRISLGQGIASSREAKRGNRPNYYLLGAFSLHSLCSCQSPCPKYVIHHISLPSS